MDTPHASPLLQASPLLSVAPPRQRVPSICTPNIKSDRDEQIGFLARHQVPDKLRKVLDVAQASLLTAGLCS